MALIELIHFCTADPAADDAFLVENRRVQTEYIRNQPGFISREVARNDDGEWLVILHWSSETDAEASMRLFESHPATQGFMALLDRDTLTVKRYATTE